MRSLRWRRARYALPVAVMAAIGGGALVPTLSGAAAPPSLAPISAQQLLTEVLEAKVAPLSGALTWTANLGLTDLSTLESELGGQSNGGGDLFSPLSLLSGSYELDVWLGGPGSEHLALSEEPGQEVDLIENGGQLWLWDSSGDQVTHLVGPASSDGAAPGQSGGESTAPLTPGQVASRLLQDVSPTTSVTLGTALYVAGQPAYQLLVSPVDAPGTTIGHIEVDVAAAGALEGVPLQVAVYAKGQSGAAISLGFSQLHLGAPPASELTFTPPPGATVVTRQVANGSSAMWPGARPSGGGQVIGSGWATVVSGSADGLNAAFSNPDLQGVTSVVQVGGEQARLFETNLLNVLITPGGGFYAGFVAPAVLEADAASSTGSPGSSSS